MFKKLSLICILLFLATTLAVAQDEQPDTEVLPDAAFVAYDCQFIKESNSVRIRSVALGSNGVALPRDSYRVEVKVAGSGEILPAESISIEPVTQRPPLQLMIVLDTTDTVPITQIVTSLTDELMPRLQPDDQVALITFSAEISPRTQFYTDKNRLVNEHMLDLLTLEGDNRLYDAIFNAVNDFPLNVERRQVVLVLTDSNRRNTEQTPLQDIITRAQRANIQIYTVGFYTRDRPDINELRTLANATGGYTWFYQEIVNSRATIEAAVRTFLEEFAVTLDNEINFTVRLQGQTPDSAGLLTLDLTLLANSEDPLNDQINCPIETLTHNINFVEEVQDVTILETMDIGVNVQSDLNLDQLRVVFRENDEVVQDSVSQIYTFNAAQHKPGYYTIGAQLIDNTGEVLATTPSTLRLYVRQSLQVNVLGQPDLSKMEGEAQFEALARPEFELRAVRFDIAPVSGGDPVPLDDTLTAFDAGGRALLSIPDIGGTIRSLFPDQPEDTRYRIHAVVPGPTTDAPDLALSNDIEVAIAPPPPPPVEVAPAVVNIVSAPPSELVPNAVLIGLVALNLLLFRWVRRAGVLRMIRNPDRHELSPQLMSVTVRRDGVKQSYVLTKKTVTLGRGSSNDINLGDDPNISRQHGVIMWRRRQWYYANRKPRAEARINGRRFIGYKRTKLVPVSEIEVGNALLVFHSNAQQDVSEFIKTNL